LPVLSLALGALLGACGKSYAHAAISELVPAPEPTDEVAEPNGPVPVEVAPPPFSEDIFPCSDCHDPDLPVRGKKRELKFEHLNIELHHAEDSRWCLDCHDGKDRDKLHLANGDLVPFEQSYRLCGQCHGDKYRDWRLGVHGRRTGYWNGKKSYLLCVHCHDAHSPAFKPLEPKPMPERPRRTP
jgi:hypothetical protein